MDSFHLHAEFTEYRAVDKFYFGGAKDIISSCVLWVCATVDREKFAVKIIMWLPQ